ncbi:MAG: RNA methyltransferase [Myxococcales bacterium]|nr:RNA methyltransferase [Myxococcales bacterium]
MTENGALRPDGQSRWPETDVLEDVVNPRRVQRIDHILGQRLQSITAVYENIYDPHNVAACMRTSEGFGLQDVHVVTETEEYRTPTTITKSADQWMTAHRWDTTDACIAHLKAEGFQIWVSDLAAEKPLAELPVEGKIALVVGNEANGVSEAIRQAADQRYILPMSGMVQSFNLSVALAISLQQVVPVRRKQLGDMGDLSVERQWSLRQRWLEFGMREAGKIRSAYEQKRDQQKRIQQQQARGQSNG